MMQSDTIYDSQIDLEESLCKRKATVAKELPAQLIPLNLSAVEAKVLLIFSLTSNETQEVNSEAYSFLNIFLEYFINVKSYIQHEAIFKEQEPVIENIVSHIISFGWGVIHGNSHGVMKTLPTDRSLVMVMKMLRIFSRIDSIASKIGFKLGLKLILQAMTRFSYCLQLQINCSACLANLASVEGNRIAMLEDGCIKLVLENLVRFRNSPAVLAEICATLANLAFHDINARYIVENNGCSLIFNAMKLHIDNIDFQIQGFQAVSCLGKVDIQILDREHFISFLVESLQRRFNDVEFLSAVWHSLGSLANAGIRLHNHKLEILKGIFSSMKRFHKNQSFQITACFALAHVFFNHRDATVDDSAVSDFKGIECILDTMKRFSDHESLQTTALFALGSIVMKSDVHRECLLKNGGIVVILDAMKRVFTAQDNLEKRTEPVLYSRGNTKVECSKPFLLQLFGSVALLNLSDNEKCRANIIELGGIHHIFQASKKVADQADLWFIVYYIFSKFTKCGDERIVFLKSRQVPALKEMARKTLMDSQLAEWQQGYIQKQKTRLDTQEPIEKDIQDYQEVLKINYDTYRISKHLKDEIYKSKPCSVCFKTCHESQIRKYEVCRSRKSIIYPLCSIQCAQADSKFSEKYLFLHNSSTDLD